MRLICPNCGAQYEVADEVIPAGGRDVQCSACGDTWFQRPGEDPETIGPRDPEPAPQPEPEPTTEPEAKPVSEPEPAPEPEPELEPEHEPEPVSEPEPEPQDPPQPRSGLDPETADILREEAELSRAAREAEQIETQPDLGLEEHLSVEEQRTREAQSRMSRLRGEPEQPANEMAAGSGDRRQLLPDIEEINDTLRGQAGTATATAAGAEAARRTGGFRRGFLIMVLLAVVAALVYINAPFLSEKVPVLEPALSAYVDKVDQARLWLDLKVQELMSGGGETPTE